MYATAKSILKQDTDCADAIQEAIVKAFGKVDDLKQEKYARTWLMRINRSKAVWRVLHRQRE
nr:sigma factor [uncultured Schaedlerella sp.]